MPVPSESIMFRRRNPMRPLASLVAEGDPCVSLDDGCVVVDFGDGRRPERFDDAGEAALLVGREVAGGEREIHFALSCETPDRHGLPSFSVGMFMDQVRDFVDGAIRSPSP